MSSKTAGTIFEDRVWLQVVDFVKEQATEKWRKNQRLHMRRWGRFTWKLASKTNLHLKKKKLARLEKTISQSVKAFKIHSSVWKSWCRFTVAKWAEEPVSYFYFSAASVFAILKRAFLLLSLSIAETVKCCLKYNISVWRAAALDVKHFRINCTEKQTGFTKSYFALEVWLIRERQIEIQGFGWDFLFVCI